MAMKTLTGWKVGERPFSKAEFERSYLKKKGFKDLTYPKYLRTLATEEGRKKVKARVRKKLGGKKTNWLAKEVSLKGL